MIPEIEIVRIPVEHSRARELAATIESARAGFLAFPRCNGCEVLTGAAGDEVIAIVRWSSVAAHEEALRSADATRFLEAVAALAAGPPEVRKYEPVTGAQ
jgi:quinol monooxygenase YgiN